MRKLLILAAVGLSLGGCASVTKTWDTITGATVSPAAVIVAGNSFDAIEATATNYLTFCKANRSVAGCGSYLSARKAILPAVRSGRVARNNLENFMAANPGALGPSGLYNALVTSINTLQAVATQYNIAGASK
jgi:hypothetical protein